MEEAKAAAYYDELSRKGEGAARFKQGLGFSSAGTSTNSGEAPARGSALASSSSFLSTFVKASSPAKASELERQSQLASIQNKLRTKKNRSPVREARVSRSRSRDRERERDRRERHREGGDRDGYRERRRRRSRSRSDSDGDRRRRERRRRRSRSRSSSPRDRRAERRNRSSSPRDRRSERRNRSRSSSPARERKTEKKNAGVDYSRLIQGYDNMSPAERVKAKMKLQLAETVEKDTTKGSSGWERFEFNKDAPLDDEEIEAAEDDTALLKHIGQSFRFTAIEANREQKIRDAHDEAMFGVPVISQLVTKEDEIANEAEKENDAETKTKAETDSDKVESNGSGMAANLLSEMVLAKQQGSWRDRARRQMDSRG